MSQARLRELAESIREYGVLEPILVLPVGQRYEVVGGNRRLQAASLAGLDRIPAVIRTEADERTRLLLNLVENAQRAELRPSERIGAVHQLAAAGLGVREIARGTGLSPATISRWVRIAARQPLLAALEEGRIDLLRAMHLAAVRDPALLLELIEVAPHQAPEDLYALVQQCGCDEWDARRAERQTPACCHCRSSGRHRSRDSRGRGVTPAHRRHRYRLATSRACSCELRGSPYGSGITCRPSRPQSSTPANAANWRTASPAPCTDIAGSMPFVYIHTLWFGLWTVDRGQCGPLAGHRAPSGAARMGSIPGSHGRHSGRHRGARRCRAGEGGTAGEELASS